MELRFWTDPDTGLPHIFGHGITEEEVREVMGGQGEDVATGGDTRMKLGQTWAGRYVQVIYVPDPEPRSYFVITAFDLGGKGKRAYRRRQRRKGR